MGGGGGGSSEVDPRWQPDGWDAAVRIGLLTPAADVGPECELAAMAPVWAGIHAARVPFGAMGPGGAMDPTIALQHVRAFADPPGVDEAVGRLADAPLDVIGFGFTSSSYVIGAVGEAAMVERLTERARGIPVVTACAGTVEALRSLGTGRVALISPPWFDDELNRLGRQYYEDAGVEVLDVVSCPLPSDQRSITPAGLHAAITGRVDGHADAVVIGGNGLRAVGAVAALEESLGRPVVTANQALLWAALRRAGAATVGITRYGKLFRLDAPSS